MRQIHSDLMFGHFGLQNDTNNHSQRLQSRPAQLIVGARLHFDSWSLAARMYQGMALKQYVQKSWILLTLSQLQEQAPLQNPSQLKWHRVYLRIHHTKYSRRAKYWKFALHFARKKVM